MTEVKLLTLSESIPSVVEEPLRRSRTMECILMLEKLADRGSISAVDMERLEYAALEREPRFELLRRRLEQANTWGTNRLGIAEHHWAKLGEEFLGANANSGWEELHEKRQFAAITFAAIAILNGDDAALNDHCDWCVDTGLSVPLLSVINENLDVDKQEMLESFERLHQKDPKPYHLYRIAILHYRLGEWDAAIRAATESQAIPWSGHVINHVVTAMAMFQRGDTEEARTYFTERTMEFDSGSVSAWNRFHDLETITLVLLRREAEELLFDRSDSHEMDSIMSLARGGDFAAAIKRLESFESRHADPSPRFRFSMARAFAQCWHHMRNDPNVDDQEQERIRDRAIDLIVRLHAAGY